VQVCDSSDTLQTQFETMKRNPSIVGIAACLLLGHSLVSGEVVFQQNFSSGSSIDDYKGESEHRFDFIDRAGEAVTASIAEGGFQAVVAYDPDNPGLQNSAIRLNRLTPIDFADNFAVVQCRVTIHPNDWPSSRVAFFQFAIGENFRATPYNPARENMAGEGPAFVSVMLNTAPDAGSFTFSIGRKNQSGEFHLASSDGAYEIPLTMAFNASEQERSFESPGGPATIHPGSMSVWIGEDLIWDNAQPEKKETVKLENFSFGFGRGTDSVAAEAREVEGTFTLTDISISSPKP